MYLPQHILSCIDALEASGFAAYAVGGCVRDACLGLTPHDYDLCTSALPEQIESVFSDRKLVLAGKKHGTVGVIFKKEVVEITTFRTEGDYQDNRHPDWVEFVPNVEQDLARRDFTVNAMAYSPTRGYADPFGGREDLKNHILRAVGNPPARFREDSLRILRGVRFAVRFRLTPDADTLDAMKTLAPLMDNLARERVFDELCKLLPLVTAQDLIDFAPILSTAIPELAPMVGFDQRCPYHAYDLFTHTAQVCAATPGDLTLRWAGLLHDVGKIPCFTLDEGGRGHFYGHAQESARMADAILRRLKAPTALRENVVALIDLHMTKIEPTKKSVRRWLSRLGSDKMDLLINLQQADMGSKGTGNPKEAEQFPQIRAIIEEIQAENACLSLKDLAVNGSDLLALGFPAGKALGNCLNWLLGQILDETLENNRDILLDAARNYGIREGIL